MCSLLMVESIDHSSSSLLSSSTIENHTVIDYFTTEIPAIQVVIEDNNEIKLKPSKSSSSSFRSNHNHKHHQYNNAANNDDFQNRDNNHPVDVTRKKFFNDPESIEDFNNLDLKRISRGNDDNNYHQGKYIQTFESPARYLAPKLINPSFSKIPDDYLKPIGGFDDDEEEDDVRDHGHINHVNDNEIEDNLIDRNPGDHYTTQSLELSSNPPKPMIVPIGSRTHFIRYKDYRQPESSKIISKFDYENDQKVEPSVIELPSSQPVLPIVFNFKTKSAPIFAKTTHFRMPTTPEYKFTQESPHIREHIVHKPIIQDLKEIIVPYRFYVQEIAPVSMHHQTFIPYNKYSTFNNNDMASAMTKIPVYIPADIQTNFEKNFKPATTHHHTTTINHLVPIYDSTTSTSIAQSKPMAYQYHHHNQFQNHHHYNNIVSNSPSPLGLFGHKNPYADYLHPPFRVATLAVTDENNFQSLKQTPSSFNNYRNNFNHFNYYN